MWFALSSSMKRGNRYVLRRNRPRSGLPSAPEVLLSGQDSGPRPRQRTHLLRPAAHAVPVTGSCSFGKRLAFKVQGSCTPRGGVCSPAWHAFGSPVRESNLELVRMAVSVRAKNSGGRAKNSGGRARTSCWDGRAAMMLGGLSPQGRIVSGLHCLSFKDFSMQLL